jgi:hypothetical protein
VTHNVRRLHLQAGAGVCRRKGSKVFFPGTLCRDTKPRLRETACCTLGQLFVERELILFIPKMFRERPNPSLFIPKMSKEHPNPSLFIPKMSRMCTETFRDLNNNKHKVGLRKCNGGGVVLFMALATLTRRTRTPLQNKKRRGGVNGVKHDHTISLLFF